MNKNFKNWFKPDKYKIIISALIIILGFYTYFSSIECHISFINSLFCSNIVPFVLFTFGLGSALGYYITENILPPNLSYNIIVIIVLQAIWAYLLALIILRLAKR